MTPRERAYHRCRLRSDFPAPAMRTDTTWLANRDDGFGSDERSRRRAYAKARAAGVNPTGKVYLPQLCRPGKSLDPAAWVSDLHDVKQKCIRRGMGCERVGVKLPERLPAPERPYQPAEDLVQRAVEARVREEAQGDASPRERAELAEMFRTKGAGNLND